MENTRFQALLRNIRCHIFDFVGLVSDQGIDFNEWIIERCRHHAAGFPTLVLFFFWLAPRFMFISWNLVYSTNHIYIRFFHQHGLSVLKILERDTIPSTGRTQRSRDITHRHRNHCSYDNSTTASGHFWVVEHCSAHIYARQTISSPTSRMMTQQLMWLSHFVAVRPFETVTYDCLSRQNPFCVTLPKKLCISDGTPLPFGA